MDSLKEMNILSQDYQESPEQETRTCFWSKVRRSTPTLCAFSLDDLDLNFPGGVYLVLDVCQCSSTLVDGGVCGEEKGTANVNTMLT